MVETTTGLILRTHPLTETSLVVHWLTPEFGRMATVAKGACRAKSPFRGKLDLFYLADFSFSPSRRSDLHSLREVSLRNTHAPLRYDLGYLHQACYCVRLLEQTTETDTPLQPIFELLCGFLDWLPSHEPQAQAVFSFELKLLAELGLQPDFTRSRMRPPLVAILHCLSEEDWPEVARTQLNRSDSAEINHFLHGFLIYHLGRLAKGRDAAVGHAVTARAEQRPPGMRPR